jgi:hypothetical protein
MTRLMEVSVREVNVPSLPAHICPSCERSYSIYFHTLTRFADNVYIRQRVGYIKAEQLSSPAHFHLGCKSISVGLRLIDAISQLIH